MCRVAENLPHFGVGRKFAPRGVSWGFMKNEDAAHSDAWGFWPLSDHGHGPTCGRDGGGARDISELQSRSFAENREYCGYIGLMPDGTYMATEVTRGTSDSCLSRGDESRFVEVTASFHTHAGYNPDADSEVPSVEDLAGDIDEGVNGYVATPGGGYG